jgi:hypothetical protein
MAPSPRGSLQRSGRVDVAGSNPTPVPFGRDRQPVHVVWASREVRRGVDEHDRCVQARARHAGLHMTRHLSEEEAAAAVARATPIAPGRPAPRRPRSVLTGLDPTGAPVGARLEGPSLVLFLSTSCDGCADLAQMVREGTAGFDVLGVLRVPPGGLPSEEVATFVGAGGRWLLGDDAFEAFDVYKGPFFSVVDETGRLVVEGVALGRDHVVEHCANALAGVPEPGGLRLRAED